MQRQFRLNFFFVLSSFVFLAFFFAAVIITNLEGDYQVVVITWVVKMFRVINSIRSFLAEFTHKPSCCFFLQLMFQPPFFSSPALSCQGGMGQGKWGWERWGLGRRIKETLVISVFRLFIGQSDVLSDGYMYSWPNCSHAWLVMLCRCSLNLWFFL